MSRPVSANGLQPVRKIGKSHRAITGSLASSKTPTGAIYESALERDFYLQLDFDPQVVRFVPQPVAIPLLSPRRRTYTPDVLVHYAGQRSPALFEVKYVDEIVKDPAVFRRRFQAARAYARTQGWTFTLMTERAIRGPALKNIHFLRPYASRVIPEETKLDIMRALSRLEVATPEAILAGFPAAQRLALLPALWHLMACQWIVADLYRPVTMKSLVWASQDGPR